MILVYPGGGREVAKRKGESYKLIWKERMGFARLAIEHGYTIVPFAAVGAEEAVDIVLDGDNPLMAPTRLFVGRSWAAGHHADHARHRTHAHSPPGTPVLLVRKADIDKEPARATPRRRGRSKVREQTKKAIEEGMGFLLVERRTIPTARW